MEYCKDMVSRRTIPIIAEWDISRKVFSRLRCRRNIKNKISKRGGIILARVAGVDIPRNKRVEIALTYIYGIGRPTSQKVLKEAGVNFDTRVKDLTEEEVNKIREIINGIKVEGDLRKEVRLSIKRLMDIKCYRGLRHKMNLPVRGQSSKTNARTVKGPKKPIRK